MVLIDQPVSIRQFRFPADYPSVFRLWEQAGPGIHLRISDTYPEIEKKNQRDPELFLVAQEAVRGCSGGTADDHRVIRGVFATEHGHASVQVHGGKQAVHGLGQKRFYRRAPSFDFVQRRPRRPAFEHSERARVRLPADRNS